MHFHCEIVMPPTDDVPAAVASIMKPFSEEPEEGDADHSGRGFWDFYVIGGRWAGSKTVAQYDKETVAAFWAWCNAADIKVMGLTAGKQTIATAEMRERVDAKWNEMFPSAVMVACPLFDHAVDQLGLRGSSTLDGDVACFADVPRSLSCARVIIAAPSYATGDVDDPASWTGPVRPMFMLAEDTWNGVNHMPVKWDGTLADALRQYGEKMGGYRESCRIASTPTDNWLVVTVDYHS